MMNTTLVLMRNMQDNGDIDRNVVDKATQKFRRSLSIFTARIRRMGKVMFSQVCVRPHPLCPSSRFFPRSVVPGPFPGDTPVLAGGGYPSPRWEEYPSPRWGRTTGLRYPPSRTGLGYPPVQDRTGVHPPDQD